MGVLSYRITSSGEMYYHGGREKLASTGREQQVFAELPGPDKLYPSERESGRVSE